MNQFPANLPLSNSTLVLALGSDFGAWRESTIEQLILTDLIDHVADHDGITLDKEAVHSANATPQEIKQFKTESRKALSIIWTLLDKSIQSQVRQSKTGPVALWKELESRFASISADSEIRRATSILARSQPVPLSEVDLLLSDVFTAQATLERHGLHYPVASLVNLFHMCLPKDIFQNTLESIRVSDLSLTVSSLSQILQSRLTTVILSRDDRLTTSNAFHVSNNNNNNNSNYNNNINYCKNCGHNHNQCPHPARESRSLYEFYKEFKISPPPHRIQSYNNWIKAGCPSQAKAQNSVSKSEFTELLSLVKSLINKRDGSNYSSATHSITDSLYKATNVDSLKHHWIMDSGASQSYTWDQSLFSTFSKCSGAVTIGNGKCLEIIGKGDVTINIFRNNCDQSITLHDVYLVPELTCNLLSLGAATSRGCEYTGKGDEITVTKSNVIKLIGKRNYKSGIVELVQFKSSTEANDELLHGLVVATTRSTPAHGSLYYWHVVLNHRNPLDIIKLSKNPANGIILNSDDWPGCASCELCKITRTPQPTLSEPHEPNSMHFDTIVGDVIGKISIPTINGEFYASLFMDIRTRYASVKLHSNCNSSEVTKHLIEFMNLIERQPDKAKNSTRRIRCVRTDMASYYTSDEFGTLLHSKGVVHQFSAPYVPQQNGLAERLNRTLIESTRATLHQGNLPIQFWGFALEAVVTTYNLSPHSAKHDKSPHYLLFGEETTLNHLKPIGSRCTYLLRTTTTKFSPKGKPAILIGYPPFTKAYRLWDENDGKIILSNDVRFNDDDPVTNNNIPISSPAIPVNPTPYNSVNQSTTQPPTNMSSPVPYPHNSDVPDTTEIPTQTESSSEIEIPAQTSLPSDSPSVPDSDDSELNINVLPLKRTEHVSAIERIKNLKHAFIGITTEPFRFTVSPIVDQSDLPTSMPCNEPQLSNTSIAMLIKHSYDPNYPTLKEALSGPQKDLWQQGINKELDTLWSTGTWTAVKRDSISQGLRPITAKLHLRVKTDPVRNTTQYKARFVCRGFNQIAGIDYNETYSPVANFRSIQTLLTIGAHYDYEIHQLDFDAAFLNANIKEEVYIEPIPNVDSRIGIDELYRLNKTLYGLKQSPREWWILLRTTLCALSWHQCLTDQCVFFRDDPQGRQFLAVYVDDLILFTPNTSTMTNAKAQLLHSLESKDLGELSYILGVKVHRDRHK